MKQTFGDSFRYDIWVYHNLIADDLNKEVSGLAKLVNFEWYASLVVVLLSHGGEGTVCASDWKQLRINDLKLEFDNVNCPQLKNKPKIFIVQACQGDKVQTAAERMDDDAKPVPTDEQIDCRSVDPLRRYNITDYLTIMATIPDFKAIRYASNFSK